MNDIKETWYKWDYVCPDCDANIVMIAKSNGQGHDSYCLKCAGDLTLMSVVDDTIVPSTTKKEETNMETITETPAPQTITLTWQNNNVEEITTYTENDIRSAIYNNRRYAENVNEYYRKESQLRTLLEEVYADSNEQDTLSQIAEIFDVPLTKEIEVTAYVRVALTIEVDMAEGDYDIESLVSENLTVDSYDSIVSVNDYTVERVEEGAY
jgi:Zn-finger nucleic acid-binding protein